MSPNENTAREPFDLRLILDSVPAMVAYWDRNEYCHFANSAYREWFGVSPEDLIGRTLRQLLGDTLYQKNEPYIRGALRGERQHFDRVLTKTNGEIRHVDAHYIPDRFEGQIRGFYVMVVDFSEQKLLELQLREARDQLEDRVAERTAELEAAKEQIRSFLRTLDHQIEAERRRLARDVHDQIGQIFTGLKMGLRAQAAQLPPEFVRDLGARLDEGMQVARRVSADLRPPLLDDLGLALALEPLADSLLRKHGIQVRIDVSDDEHLSADQANQLFRITQEALTNILRHADAREVRIDGLIDGRVYRLLIENDGKPYDPQRVAATSLGISGMRERAALIGADLQIQPGPTGGAHLVVRLPIAGPPGGA